MASRKIEAPRIVPATIAVAGNSPIERLSAASIVGRQLRTSDQSPCLEAPFGLVLWSPSSLILGAAPSGVTTCIEANRTTAGPGLPQHIAVLGLLDQAVHIHL